MEKLEISKEWKFDHYINNWKMAWIRCEKTKKTIDIILRMTKSEQDDLKAWCNFNFDQWNYKTEHLLQYFERPERKW